MPKPIRRSDGKVLKSPDRDQVEAESLLQRMQKVKIRTPPKETPVYKSDERGTVRTLCHPDEDEEVEFQTFDDYKKALLASLDFDKHVMSEDDKDDDSGIDIDTYTREV